MERSSVILCLLLCTVLACGGSAGSQSSSNSNDDANSETETALPSSPPSITHLPVTIAAYDAETGKAGDVDFSFQTIGNTGKIFLEFQGVITEASGTQDEERLPHFTFNLPSGTPVYSMVAGTVTAVELNDNHPDSEIRIAPTGAPDFVSTYDHLQNVTVAVGDVVAGGDKLGEAAATKIEADIADFSQSPNLSYCPVTFFSEAVRSQHVATLTQLMADWESFSSDTAIYDEAAMSATGCAQATGNL